MKHLSVLVKELVDLIKEVGRWHKDRLKRNLKREHADVRVLRERYEDLVREERVLADLLGRTDKEVFGREERPPVIGSAPWRERLETEAPALAAPVRKAEKKVRDAAIAYEAARQECLHTFDRLELDLDRVERLAGGVEDHVAIIERESGGRKSFEHTRLLLEEVRKVVRTLREEVVENERLARYDQVPEGTTAAFDAINRLQAFRLPGDERSFNLFRKVREESGVVDDAQREAQRARTLTTFFIDGFSLPGMHGYVLLDTSFVIRFKDFIHNQDLEEFFKVPNGFERATWGYVPLVVSEAREYHTRRVFNRLKIGMGLHEVRVDIDARLRGEILRTYAQTTKGRKRVREIGQEAAFEEFEKDADFQIIGFAMRHRCAVIGHDKDLEEMLGHVAGATYYDCSTMEVFEELAA